MNASLQVLCVLACTSQEIREYEYGLYPLQVHASIISTFLRFVLLAHRRFAARVNDAFGVYNDTRTSTNIFVSEGAETLKIVTAGLVLKAGDVIGYEFQKEMVGTPFSPLHMALVLENGEDTDGNPEIIDMGPNGIAVTRWADFSDFVPAPRRYIVRLRLTDDSHDARQRAVVCARTVYQRFLNNPELFPAYHEKRWNCDSFVCACLTQGACSVSGQVLNAAAFGARLLVDVAGFVKKNII